MSEAKLVPLLQWVETRLTNLYSAHEEEDFEKAFNQWVEPRASIVQNGAKIGREQYKEILRQKITTANKAEMEFTTSVTVPGRLPETGCVGIFFVATLKYGQKHGPGLKPLDRMTLSMNVVVDMKESDFFDGRHVHSLDEVVSTEIIT